MNLSPQTKLTELAQYIQQNGDTHSRSQMRATPSGGMAFDETAPVVITRIIRVQFLRAKGYATFDGETLRLLNLKTARNCYAAVLTDEGFVSTGGMGWKGGKLMHTLADWQEEGRVASAGFTAAFVVRERI